MMSMTVRTWTGVVSACIMGPSGSIAKPMYTALPANFGPRFGGKVYPTTLSPTLRVSVSPKLESRSLEA